MQEPLTLRSSARSGCLCRIIFSFLLAGSEERKCRCLVVGDVATVETRMPKAVAYRKGWPIDAVDIFRRTWSDARSLETRSYQSKAERKGARQMARVNSKG